MINRLSFAFLCFAVLIVGTLPVRAVQNPIADAEHEYEAGQYNRAIDILAQAVGKSAADAPLHFVLGQCYYQIRDYSRAANSFERSVQLTPGQSEYHDWLGKAYGRKAENAMFLSAIGLARKTHKEFEIAVHLDPSNFDAQRT